MKGSLRSILDEKFAEYNDWVKKGVAEVGIYSLAQGLRLTAQSPKDRDEFVRELRARVQPTHLQRAATEAMARWRRAMHVMSIGTEFNEHEFILLLGIRLEVELVSEVLRLFGVDTGGLPLAPIDEELRVIANAKTNRREFASAVSMMKKNCGVPFEDIWTSEQERERRRQRILMNTALKLALEDKLEEYDDWVARDAADLGILSLGRGLRLAAQSPKDRDELVREVRARVQPEHLQKAAIDAMDSWRRAMHIMSSDTKLDEHEITQLLALRRDIEHVCDVLRLFGIDTEHLPLEPIDDQLRVIAKSKEHRRNFAKAVRDMKEYNGGIPFEDIWSK